MDRRAFLRTMRTLEGRYPLKDWTTGMTPFEVLVSTILSQSTTAANERRGLEDLRLQVGAITPDRLAATSDEEIARAIWHAGLARQKAPRIRATAAAIRDKWDGRVERILSLPTERARAELMALPGVGPKTADVVLAMAGGRPTFPVDTHIARIARRWELTRRKDYESIRSALEEWTPPAKRKAWHLAIIAHGRALCKARNPRCEDCPVQADCDWYRRSRLRPRPRRPRPRRRGTRDQSPDGPDDRPRFRRVYRRLHFGPEADPREQHRDRRIRGFLSRLGGIRCRIECHQPSGHPHRPPRIPLDTGPFLGSRVPEPRGLPAGGTPDASLGL